VTQSSTVAVAAQSKNTAATAQKAQQAAGTAPAAAAPPVPGAVADRAADPSAPVSCVNVAPGTDATRIVITLGKSCRHRASPEHAAPKRVAAAPKTHEAPVRAAPPPAPAPAPAPAPTPAPPRDAYRITTVHPSTYNEARTIGEAYRDGRPVIMNLTDLDDADAKRLVDFAAGLIFGLRGSIERVTAKVFLLSPQNVDVTAEDKARIREGGFFNQS
jgi:cell division inhibitor SepF